MTVSKTRKSNKTRGTLFVVSAPSGAGKTTLCKLLLKKNPDLKLSVSYTTRPPRKGERDNIDYTFISKARFMKMIDKGEFAEWATVHGNLYGTSIRRLKEFNRAGYDIILDIDTRGAMQIKKRYEDALYIFILPPSMEVLRKRLVNRGTDPREVIAERLDNAKKEIAYSRHYDYIVVNDKIDKAYNELESIIISSRLRTSKVGPKRTEKIYKIK
ncbi:MAG: guanylate kinase [Nitrospirota bacterium]